MDINFDDKMVLDTLDEKPKVNSNLDKWLTFLTEPKKEGMEVLEIEDPAIRKAITVLDMLSRDPETVRLAELRMKKIIDDTSMLEGAKEEGKIEGKIEEKIEITKNALKKGFDISAIIDITGLSEEEVLKIKDEMDNN